MRDVASLIENHQNLMSEMHRDFMSLMQEYLSTEETQEEEHHEKAVIEKDREKDNAEKEIDEEESPDEYPNEDLPNVEASVDGDIDIDDPAYSYGVSRGIPMSVYLGYHPRGPLGLLDMKNGYFVENK